MRYLFFDIECCNGRDICEFGYVITDEKFNLLKKNDIIINPENKFSLTGRSDGRDLYLYYPKETYYRSNKFPYYYGDIKKLIEHKDQIIVGHSMINDAMFLRTACNRYGLSPINFKFADSQRMFSDYANIRNSISLERASESLNVEMPIYLHKSDDDSELTMNLVKGMCDELKCTLEELIKLCDACTGKSENNNIYYDDQATRKEQSYDPAKEHTSNKNKGLNYKKFLHFLKSVKPQGNIVESPINGKIVCISFDYEKRHYKEMLSIVQVLANNGATYKTRASESDIFVAYATKNDKNKEETCSRLRYVNAAIEEGKYIQIISFEEFLNILNVKEEELSTMPFPNTNSSNNETKLELNNKKPAKKEPRPKGTTLGDAFSDFFDQIRKNIDE